MTTLTRFVVATAIALTVFTSVAQEKAKGKGGKKEVLVEDGKEFVYKKTPQGELKLYVNYPPDWKASDQRPAIVFFFGGGWKNGLPTQFLTQAQYLATRGLVTVRADYRVFSRQHTTPDKCVEDAKSTIRWVRSHAKELGIDANRIVGSGGSAGGHLAAATLSVEGFNGPDDDLSVSCKPNILVLFNPALNLENVGGTITNAAGENIGHAVSPTPYLKKGAPGSIVFFGTDDRLNAHGREYLAKSKEMGVPCELYMAAGQPHGFFNRSPWKEVTLKKADEFLVSAGYLKGKPTLQLPDDAKPLVREE